jgi:hypothetical protein
MPNLSMKALSQTYQQSHLVASRRSRQRNVEFGLLKYFCSYLEVTFLHTVKSYDMGVIHARMLYISKYSITSEIAIKHQSRQTGFYTVQITITTTPVYSVQWWLQRSHTLPYLLDCKPTYFSLFKNAPQLRISVIHVGLIMQASFTGRASEAYSTTIGQCEHILHIQCLSSVCFIFVNICVVPCVPGNLFIFSMK